MKCLLCGTRTKIQVGHASYVPVEEPLCRDHACQWHAWCYLLTEMGILAEWTEDDIWWLEMNGVQA